MAGTYFNKRRKLGILDKNLDASDVISVFSVLSSLFSVLSSLFNVLHLFCVVFPTNMSCQ